MKILHLSTGDVSGGAFRGSYWLHNALVRKGIESNILVAKKESDDFSIIRTSQSPYTQNFDRAKKILDQVPLLYYPARKKGLFSPALTSASNLQNAIQLIKPDLINIHWVSDGFLRPEDISRFQVPVVWTLRDMWAFTGGCHYAGNCTKYQEHCGACPHLASASEHDLSRKLWRRKQKAWQNSNFTFVAISRWLADCARNSSLFQDKRIEVIGNALDAQLFRPLPKQVAREILRLPLDKQIIAFGAINATSNPIKGFQYLLPALHQLSDKGFSETAEFVVFGSSKPQQGTNLGIKTTYLGRLHDDITLALVYSAADVMVVPSLQEAFGKTAIEAMACGTPVVSFDSTGLKDIVDHQQNGYRAECFSEADLAAGIQWVLADQDRWHHLSTQARQKVELQFTLEKQANAYIQLYHEILSTQ
jgi:glycosyltransferase involved in cell wall biosynthesis